MFLTDEKRRSCALPAWGKNPSSPTEGGSPFLPPAPTLPLPSSSRPRCPPARGSQCFASPLALVGCCARGACAGLALPSPAACCSPCHPLFLFPSWRSFLSLLLSCTKEHLPGQQKCLEITTAASPELWGKRRMRRWFPSVGAAWGTRSSFVLLGKGCPRGRLPGGWSGGSMGEGREHPWLLWGRAMAGATGG